MQPRLTRRKGAALLATAGLVAGGLTAFGVTGAGAVGPATPTPPAAGSTSGPTQNDCTAADPTPGAPVGSTVVNPTITSVSGVSPDSELYPDGATAAFTGVLAVTVPGAYTQNAINNLPAGLGLVLNNVGVVVHSGTVNAVDATGAVKGSFNFTGPATVQKSAPDLVNGNTFTVNVSGTVTTDGADADSLGFVPGVVQVDTVLDLNLAPNQTLVATSCVVNNQDGTLDAGEGPGFGLPYPAAPAANIALVATAPVVADQGTTVSSASPTSTYQVAAALATPQASLAAGGASSGTPAAIVDYQITPLAATGGATINPTTGLITYTPPNNQFAGPETFTVIVTDALGAQGSGTVTLDVVAGDATSADVQVTINGAVGSQLFIPQCGPNVDVKSAPCPTITMTAINLNGKKQTSTGQIGQITVVDARGLPLQWTLSATLDGNLTNQNPPSGSLVTDGNNIIPADQLTMEGQSCVVDVVNGGGGDFSAATPGSSGTLDGSVIVCQAAIGQSGGTFLANANLSLNVNPDLYVGTYAGTINFLLA